MQDNISETAIANNSTKLKKHIEDFLSLDIFNRKLDKLSTVLRSETNKTFNDKITNLTNFFLTYLFLRHHKNLYTAQFYHNWNLQTEIDKDSFCLKKEFLSELKVNYEFNDTIFTKYANYLFEINIPFDKHFSQFKLHDTKIETLKEIESEFSDFLKQLAPKHIILVEGKTEELLIPHIAYLMGYDFQKLQIKIITCNGCQNLIKQYKKISNLITIPIISLLDGDAIEYHKTMNESCRKYDKIIFLNEKELENYFNEVNFDKIISKHPLYYLYKKNKDVVNIDDYKNSKIWLNNIAKKSGIKSLSKLDYAKLIQLYLTDPKYIPTDAKSIINKIVQEVLAQNE